MNLNQPLRYLIGIDNPSMEEGYLTEVSYDSTDGDIGYCNLFDEKNTGQYGPYRHDSDTASDYNEGEIDPTGPGWEANLRSQFERRQGQGFEYIELDNPDAYEVKDVLEAIKLAAEYNLRVLAKNPGLTEDPISYVKQCQGIIVERGAGSPSEMDQLRRDAGNGFLPIWFVSFGPEGHKWVMSLDTYNYKNMYRSYSRQGEYRSSETL